MVQDIADKEMQIIHNEFLMEKESRINHQEAGSRLRNINDLTDMGFSLNGFSPIPTIRVTAPLIPVGSGTTTPVPTCPYLDQVADQGYTALTPLQISSTVQESNV